MPACPLVPSRFSDWDVNVAFWEMPLQIILRLTSELLLSRSVTSHTTIMTALSSQRLGQLPKTQLEFCRQNSSRPRTVHTNSRLLHDHKKVPTQKKLWGRVNLVYQVLFCPQGQFYVGRTSILPVELWVHFSRPTLGKLSACEELSVWNGEYDWKPQYCYSFFNVPFDIITTK